MVPPRDADTARAVSELLGERLLLEASASQSAQERGAELGALGGPSGGSAGASLSVRHRPVLTPAQALALPAGTVVCLSRGLRFLAADSRTALWPAVQAPAPAPRPRAGGLHGGGGVARTPATPEDAGWAAPDDALRWAALLAQLDDPAPPADAPEVEPDDAPAAAPVPAAPSTAETAAPPPPGAPAPAPAPPPRTGDPPGHAERRRHRWPR